MEDDILVREFAFFLSKKIIKELFWGGYLHKQGSAQSFSWHIWIESHQR